MIQQSVHQLIQRFNGSANHCFRFVVRRTFSDQFQEKTYLLKPTLFVLGVTGASFAGCAILQYEKRRTKHRWTFNTNFDRFGLKAWLKNLHEGHKVAAGIIASNICVFVAWQLPFLRSTMLKWFTTNPTNKRSLPLLLSCFSHSEFWHIGANMFVLWSFAPLVHNLMGTEQFIAFYLAGGAMSSLVGHYFKIATRSRIPSLGASGALLAVLAVCCIGEPEARLSILFLPFFTFSAKTALCGIIALDITGILLRWKMLDHAAHLGGTMFGSWYIFYGHTYMWRKREVLLHWWERQRKSLGWK